MADMEKQSLPRSAYGNIDITRSVPQGCTHVRGQRLTVTCKAAGIESVPAIVDWRRRRQSTRPILDGVIIWSVDLERLHAAIERRDARRPTPIQRAEARARRQERDAESFAAEIISAFPGMPADDLRDCAEHATEIGSGRIGRVRDDECRAQLAVWAYIRHRYTQYDELLRNGWERSEARELVDDQIDAISRAWEEHPEQNRQHGSTSHAA
jgi:hypothetical protein